MRKRLLCFLFIVSVYSAVGYWPFALAADGSERNPAFAASFAQGERAFAQGNYPLAITAYQAALFAAPDHLRTLFRLGQSFSAIGQQQEAYGQFQKILLQQPANVVARIELAKCLLKNGDTTEACKHLEWVLRVQPNHPIARTLLSASQATDKNPKVQEEVQDGKAMLQTGSDGPALAKTSRQPLPQGTKVKIPAPEKDSREQVTYQPWQPVRKKPANNEKLIPEADTDIQGWRVSDFLQQSSDSLGITIEYGKFCIEKGDLKKAHQVLAKAEKLAEKAPEQGRMLEIQVHKALMALYEADVRLFGQLILRLKPVLSKETLANFLDIYNKAEVAKTPVDVARIVGGVALGADHFAVAGKILGEVVSAAPNDTFALRLLGQAQLENRDYAAAEQSFQRLVALEPKDAEANFNLSRFYLTGKFDLVRARSYAANAIQLNPSDTRAKILLAAINYFEGRDQEARETLNALMPDLKDQSLKMIAQRILNDCRTQGSEQSRQEFASELALPGSDRAPRAGMSKLGEDFLRRGSFFTALKCFLESRNLAEIGRVYLALASNLAAGGDAKGASVAAGFGMNALNAELKQNPASSRAHLYLALYHFERKDRASSLRHIEAGLRSPNSPETVRQLSALKNQLG